MSEDNVEPIPKVITKKDKIKLEILTEPNFTGCLTMFGELDFEAQHFYWIGKVIAKYNSVMKDFNHTRTERLKKYAELDKDGGFIFEEVDGKKTNQVKFKSTEDKNKFEAEIKALKETEVEILKLSHEVVLKNKTIKGKPLILAGIDEIFY